MLNHGGALLFSASDLVNFLGCTHATFLDLRQLGEPVEINDADEYMEMLQEKGHEHEQAYLAQLRDERRSVVEIARGVGLEERVAATRAAMAQGPDVIYQGALIAPPWHGYSDFLMRHDGERSRLGAFHYEVADTKLARSVKPKHVVQLCVYSALVGREQGILPRSIHVVLGNGTVASLSLADFFHYFHIARGRFEALCAAPPPSSSGEPCGHCGYCRWAGACELEWEKSDHLSLVAGITRGQVEKLSEAGVGTMTALGRLASGFKVSNLHRGTFERLRSQASLQVAKRDTGENRYEILAPVPGKGFGRLPRSSPGDLFFDMEGDPLYPEGSLEYLFGFAHQEAHDVRYTAFWAHDRVDEKAKFEQAVDFIAERLRRYPEAHIYHYAAYEETALKRLAMYHGTREIEVDDLLRGRKLVDLYRVVRESVRVSEPGYSIKNLEAFYLGRPRSGEVQTAGDSIVIYERWRRLQDPAFLEEIERYNETDCRSTRMCRDWLLGLRPAATAWFDLHAAVLDPKERAREEKRRDAEACLAAATQALTKGVTAEEAPWRALLAQLLEFHRREAKPEWWAMFSRMEMSEEELLDDVECLAGLVRDTSRRIGVDKKSTVHHFIFPAQDFKLRKGDHPVRADTGEPAGEIVEIDEESLTISLKIGPSRTLPDCLSLIPRGPLADTVLRDAIHRYAQGIAGGSDKAPAVTAILREDPPRVTGLGTGAPIVPVAADVTEASIDAIARLDRSYMLVQGPPGAGKTYTASHAIVELLRRGRRVGVSSHSHKAINHLLEAVEEVAHDRGVRFAGIKKSTDGDQFFDGDFIRNTISNDDACNGGHQLVAGTAWLFARPDLDGALDYLFIDEGGQVSLANVVAMGMCARNLVLVGDQMQLSQPIQGAHPGNSGLSALEYLLEGHATVPADRGIFLPETRRMNPAICRFISEAVYDGRLMPVRGNEHQRLLLGRGADEALAPAGLRFVAVEHEGCAQKSEEEADRLALIYQSLLGQRWVDRDQVVHPIGVSDILVVSPYNMQVNLLRSKLPAGAQVGTVDKFQGQEAPVVLISMATSSGDEIPRNIDFLFSRNRLNVAISRARCLAVVLASPRLLEVPCSRIEQMRLVNTLCWAKRYVDGECAVGTMEDRA